MNERTSPRATRNPPWFSSYRQLLVNQARLQIASTLATCNTSSPLATNGTPGQHLWQYQLSAGNQWCPWPALVAIPALRWQSPGLVLPRTRSGLERFPVVPTHANTATSAGGNPYGGNLHLLSHKWQTAPLANSTRAAGGVTRLTVPRVAGPCADPLQGSPPRR